MINVRVREQHVAAAYHEPLGIAISKNFVLTWIVESKLVFFDYPITNSDNRDVTMNRRYLEYRLTILFGATKLASQRITNLVLILICELNGLYFCFYSLKCLKHIVSVSSKMPNNIINRKVKVGRQITITSVVRKLHVASGYLYRYIS
jgi:hypothetical protein